MTAGNVKRSAATAGPGLEATILRLVRGTRERRAIRTGQVDAIIDPATGRAMLLPEAQATLLARKARLRSLLDLFADGYWELDEQFRFTLHQGIAIGGGPPARSGVLGQHLWDLQFEHGDQIDWQTFRTQLEWRAIIRDLQLCFVDSDGRTRHIGISGEPMYDTQGQFTGYCGIVKDNDAIGESEIAARRIGKFAHAALDALAVPACALDATGTIVVTNVAWRRLATRGGDTGMAEGSNLLARSEQLLGDERIDPDATAAGIRQVIAGDRKLFRYPYFYSAAAGEHWAMANVTRLGTEAGGGALVALEDLTDARRVEQLLRLEYSVARLLAAAGSTGMALQSVVRAVAEAQCWDRGRYFRLDTAASQLVLEHSWGESAATMERVRGAAPYPASGPECGLAGRAVQSRRPHWVPDAASSQADAPRSLAHETDLGGAFVFPVLAGKHSPGVLAFASRSVRAPDEHLLQAVRSIGEQLGQFLLRRQAEDDMRHREEQARSLLELSVDWVWEQDEQFRYTRLDGAGMACIKGLLGRTLWEVPGIAVAGDDDWIKHRSEIAAQWSFCDLECAVRRADGRLDHYRISGAPTYSDAGAFTGFHGTGLDITASMRS